MFLLLSVWCYVWANVSFCFGYLEELSILYRRGAREGGAIFLASLVVSSWERLGSSLILA